MLLGLREWITKLMKILLRTANELYILLALLVKFKTTLDFVKLLLCIAIKHALEEMALIFQN